MEGKYITKLATGLIAIAVIVILLPKPAVLADTGAISVSAPDGAYSIETQVYPWPWPEWYNDTNLYAPNVTITIRPGVFGNFPGTDQISVDCNGIGNYGSPVSAGAGDLGDAFNFSPIYISNSGIVQCTYPNPGTYSPTIHVVRTGSGGCVSEGRYGNQECFSSPVTAETNYTLPSFIILPKDYEINVWPNSQSPYVAKSPQNVGFVLQAWQTNSYCPYGNCDFSVGGYFTYTIDCGDGTGAKSISGYAGEENDIENIDYNSQYISQGGGGQWVYNTFNTGPVCNYTKPGVYQVTVSTNGLSGSSGAVVGGSTVTLLPSGQLTEAVSAVPSSGEIPPNNQPLVVSIDSNASNIMPAKGSWGLVTLTLRCNGNLPLEQALAAGVNPGSAETVYGNDGQVDNSAIIDFNDAGTQLFSSTSTDFSCDYPQEGTYTPTVVVQQSGITAAAGTKVYALGQLVCDGTTVNKLNAPANFEVDWGVQNVGSCVSGGNSLATSLSGWVNNSVLLAAPIITPTTAQTVAYNAIVAESTPVTLAQFTSGVRIGSAGFCDLTYIILYGYECEYEQVAGAWSDAVVGNFTFDGQQYTTDCGNVGPEVMPTIPSPPPQSCYEGSYYSPDPLTATDLYNDYLPNSIKSPVPMTLSLDQYAALPQAIQSTYNGTLTLGYTPVWGLIYYDKTITTFDSEWSVSDAEAAFPSQFNLGGVSGTGSKDFYGVTTPGSYTFQITCSLPGYPPATKTCLLDVNQ